MARAVALNKDEPPATIAFRPPFQLLLDVEHCLAWSSELEAAGQSWEVRMATPELWRHLPAAAGLYMFVWRPQFSFRVATPQVRDEAFGWILYVGKTGADDSKATFRSRYKGEYSRLVGGDPSQLFESSVPNNRAARMRRYLTLRPLEFWFTEFGDKTRINQVERQLIRSFSPPLNDAHALLRKVSQEPAF
jgi:hypothetical protein